MAEQEKKITMVICGEHARIYIKKILHVHFRRKDYESMQSWLTDGLLKNTYSIEITLKSGNTILMEYESQQDWKDVLELLDTTVKLLY